MTLVTKLKKYKGGLEHFKQIIHFWLPFKTKLSNTFSKRIIGFVQVFSVHLKIRGDTMRLPLATPPPYYALGFNTLKYVKKYFIPWRAICQSLFEYKKGFRGWREVWNFWTPCMMQFYKKSSSWYVLTVPFVSKGSFVLFTRSITNMI